MHNIYFTGEEVLHEGWSSYDNLFGVLMSSWKTLRISVENFSIYFENSRKKWSVFPLNREFEVLN
jgi:hypothetical protein